MAITPANFKIAVPITAIDLTGPAFGRVSTRLAGVAARWGALGLGAAGAALSLVGVAAVRTGASFEDAFERAKFMTKATADEVEALEKTIQDVAFATPFSPREIALGVKELGQAGLGVQQSIGAIRPVADFAIAAELELAEASDTLLRSVKALGLPMETQAELMESMGHVSDVMTRSMVSSQTTIPLLGEAYSKVLPVLKSTRQEFVSSTAALSALADVGFKGEEGGTALRNILLRLGSPTKESQEAMRALGVDTENVYDQFGRLRNLPQILDAFGQSGRFTQVLGRIAEIEKQGGDTSYLENVAQAMKEIGATGPEFQFIADIFEQRATAPFFALMEAQRSGKLKSLADIFTDPEASRALDLTNRIMATSQGAVLRMQASWSQMLISLGKTGFLDTMARLFDVGTQFMVEVSKALPRNERFVAMMDRAQNWAMSVREALKDSRPLIDSIVDRSITLFKGTAIFLLGATLRIAKGAEVIAEQVKTVWPIVKDVLQGLKLLTAGPRAASKVMEFGSDSLRVGKNVFSSIGQIFSAKDLRGFKVQLEEPRPFQSDGDSEVVRLLKRMLNALEEPRRPPSRYQSRDPVSSALRQNSVYPFLRYS